MMYSALCRFLNKEEKYSVPKVKVDNSIIEINDLGSIEESLQKIFSKIYEIRKDDINLRKILNDKKDEAGKYFDQLRKDYHLRYEFANYKVTVPKEQKELINILSGFGFSIVYK